MVVRKGTGHRMKFPACRKLGSHVPLTQGNKQSREFPTISPSFHRGVEHRPTEYLSSAVSERSSRQVTDQRLLVLSQQILDRSRLWVSPAAEGWSRGWP